MTEQEEQKPKNEEQQKQQRITQLNAEFLITSTTKFNTINIDKESEKIDATTEFTDKAHYLDKIYSAGSVNVYTVNIAKTS